jgi:dTDP-4-amino-4,6-dideoxygalactose transaminase
MARIYLSPPDVGEEERKSLLAALDSGWVAPTGPDLDAFEAELSAHVGRHAVALSSGTGALHLALIIAGVQPGDRVLLSTLTFAATANVVRYVGAEPVFVDSDRTSWNMDPDLLAQALEDARAQGHRYAAVIVVDLYGQCADYDRISALCAEHDVLLIEDAAEAIGATYQVRPAGSFGEMAVFSFNGNKMITTSGGGAFLTHRQDWADKARFLATQARDPAPHYQHSELGYNYRLSNLLAAVGRAQLAGLERKVNIRRAHNAAYRDALGDIAGIEFMPEAPGCRSTFWLTVLTIDPTIVGRTAEDVRLHLESLDIEARPVWKPMHLQPLYEGCEIVRGQVSQKLFEQGLCLPSGSSLSPNERNRVIGGVADALAP